MRVNRPVVALVAVVLDGAAKRSILVLEIRHFFLGYGKWVGQAGLKKASHREQNE